MTHLSKPGVYFPRQPTLWPDGWKEPGCSMHRDSVALASLIVVLAGGLAAQTPQNQSQMTKQNPAVVQEQTDPASQQPGPPVQQAGPEAQPNPEAQPSPETAAAPEASAASAKESDGAVPGDSHVRIVRLSEAQGKLGLDRGTGKIEATMQNMPIVEGSRLVTADGYAEVEFEDGSTVRVAPESEVGFPQLLLHSTGVKASTVRLAKGTMYVNLEKSKDVEFTVKSGDAVMKIEPGTHMRLALDGKKSTASVFQGNVQVQSGAATATVEKKHTATIDDKATSEITVAKNIEEAPYDVWDKNAVDYHNRYARGNAFGSSLYSYGVSDLNYYGGFVNAGGCGSMWRPYFVDSGWDPYGNGVWAWYRGAGYSWVSPYPWGWLPYHSGAWGFCPGVGWGWRPGSQWMGLANGSPILTRPGQPNQVVPRGGIPARPPGPQRPGVIPRSTLVLSNRTPLVYSKMDRPENFVFQKNSAGLGVPRGTLGNLHGISNNVGRNGFVNRSVYAEPMVSRGAGPVRSGTPMAIRPGSPGGQGGQNSSAFRGGPNGGGVNGIQRGGNAAQGSLNNGGTQGSAGGFHGGGGGSMSSGSSGGASGSGAGGFHGGGGVSTGGGGASGGGGHR